MEQVWSSLVSYLTTSDRSKNLNLLSFKALSLRLLIDWILPLFHITMDELKSLNEKIYIDPQCSVAIQKVLADMKLTVYERLLLQELLCKDFHEEDVIREFGKMLDQKFHCDDDDEIMMKKKKELYQIFAIDGLGTTEMNFENNIHYLKYPLREENMHKSILNDITLSHVIAVRLLYAKNPSMTPLSIYQTIVSDDDEDANVQMYKRALGSLKEKVMEDVIKPQLEVDIFQHGDL